MWVGKVVVLNQVSVLVNGVEYVRDFQLVSFSWEVQGLCWEGLLICIKWVNVYRMCCLMLGWVFVNVLLVRFGVVLGGFRG